MHPLTHFRQKQKLSRGDLADELKCTRQTVWRWETGRRPIDLDWLPKIAKLTGIPASKLRPDVAAKMGVGRC